MNTNKVIILAVPNTASTSLVYTINNYSNYKSYQINTYPNFSSILQKKKIYSSLRNIDFKKCLNMVSGYFFHSLINKHLRTNKLTFTNPSKEFSILSQFHSDICDFDLRLFMDFQRFIFNEPKLILKQHFPPSDNNLKFFKNFKKVILTRDTNSIIKKYSHLFSFIDNNKLRLEIDMWKKKWILENNTLIINFDELINDSYKELKKIEAFTDIKFNINNNFKMPYLNKTNYK